MSSQNVFPAATKLLHAVSAACKWLTSQLELGSSVQSIIGATLTRRSRAFIAKRLWESVSVIEAAPTVIAAYRLSICRCRMPAVRRYRPWPSSASEGGPLCLFARTRGQRLDATLTSSSDCVRQVPGLARQRRDPAKHRSTCWEGGRTASNCQLRCRNPRHSR